MTIRELEIILAALEGDIIYQKNSEKIDHPAFREWFADTEKLLKKIRNELSIRKAKQYLIERMEK